MKKLMILSLMVAMLSMFGFGSMDAKGNKAKGKTCTCKFVDANKDGKCDNCNKEKSKCECKSKTCKFVDANKDGKCDNCKCDKAKCDGQGKCNMKDGQGKMKGNPNKSTMKAKVTKPAEKPEKK